MASPSVFMNLLTFKQSCVAVFCQVAMVLITEKQPLPHILNSAELERQAWLLCDKLVI